MKRKYFKEEKKSVPVSWVNTLSPTELNSSSRRGMWKDPLLVRPTGTSAVRSMDCLLGPSSESEGHSVLSNSLWRHGLYSPWNSPGQNTGVGSLSFLQGIFPTQGLNPDLPHCRRILYQLNHKGSPRILEWIAYPFSSGSSPPRNRTRVSCIAGGFFTNWAIREVPSLVYGKHLKQYLAFGKCFALDL